MRPLWTPARQLGSGPKGALGCSALPGARIITTMARNKRDYAKEGDVLVDDMLKHRELWEGAGGVFIHHKNATETIEQLKSYFPIGN